MEKENQSATASLYRELPYPGDGVVRTTIGRVLRDGLTRYSPELLKKPVLRVLDVGCGTGESTAGIARMLHNAEVTAIDVNPASLDLARRLAQQEHLKIQFQQCDVTDNPARDLRNAGLFDDDKPFDVLTSIGVLHHLDDPSVGFANIRPLIAPEGRFLTFMYSTFGRWHDIAVRRLLDSAFDSTAFQQRADAVARLQLSPRHTMGAFVRGLLARLRYGLPIVPLELWKTHQRRRNLVHVSDTFSNPREHFYTYDELTRLAQSTGWNLVGLAEQGGLPTSIEEFTHDSETRKLLASMPRNTLFDYFALQFRALGFMAWLLPAAEPE